MQFSGRWDEQLSLSELAEEKALTARDFYSAGARAYEIGWFYHLREESQQVLTYAARCADHWKKSPQAGSRETAIALRLRGHGFSLQEDYAQAIKTYKEALEIDRALALVSTDVASGLNSLAEAERAVGNLDASGGLLSRKLADSTNS